MYTFWSDKQASRQDAPPRAAHGRVGSGLARQHVAEAVSLLAGLAGLATLSLAGSDTARPAMGLPWIGVAPRQVRLRRQPTLLALLRPRPRRGEPAIFCLLTADGVGLGVTTLFCQLHPPNPPGGLLNARLRERGGRPAPAAESPIMGLHGTGTRQQARAARAVKRELSWVREQRPKAPAGPQAAPRRIKPRIIPAEGGRGRGQG